ncbi:hypothetical protein VB735_23115 [Halotia wernerae UHCC 0503]|nr:hypothetical protein [Halotia wernerae UHCC 0503]
MATKLAAFRLPEEILEIIEALAKDKGTDKTAIVTEALRLGLSAFQSGEVVIQRKQPLSVEEIEAIVDKKIEEKLGELAA